MQYLSGTSSSGTNAGQKSAARGLLWPYRTNTPQTPRGRQTANSGELGSRPAQTPRSYCRRRPKLFTNSVVGEPAIVADRACRSLPRPVTRPLRPARAASERRKHHVLDPTIRRRSVLDHRDTSDGVDHPGAGPWPSTSITMYVPFPRMSSAASLRAACRRSSTRRVWSRTKDLSVG